MMKKSNQNPQKVSLKNQVLAMAIPIFKKLPTLTDVDSR